MCDQTDIGDGWSIAAAKAPVYGWRAHVFDRATACIKPVPEPLRIPTITSGQIERRPDVGKDLILRMTGYGTGAGQVGMTAPDPNGGHRSDIAACRICARRGHHRRLTRWLRAARAVRRPVKKSPREIAVRPSRKRHVPTISQDEGYFLFLAKRAAHLVVQGLDEKGHHGAGAGLNKAFHRHAGYDP
jgi:hypothetical protein